MNATPLPPGMQDPWYDDKLWIRDWLAREDEHTLRLPAPETAAGDAWARSVLDDLRDAVLVTKHRAAGPAPYVGVPFHYEWTIGIDTHGRQIAGDTRIIHHGE